MQVTIILTAALLMAPTADAAGTRLRSGQRARVDETMVAIEEQEAAQAAAEQFEEAEVLKMEIEQARVAAAPISADQGVSSLGMALIVVATGIAMFFSLALLENRRKLSADSWLSNPKTLTIYRALTCISVAQGGLAVLRIFDSSAFTSGMLDLGSAILSYYVTQGGAALSYLPMYLICAGAASILDVLVLLWDIGNWNGSSADVARPCLCWSGIILGYHFLKEVRKSTSEKSDGVADKLLEMVLAYPLVQQFMYILGTMPIDPLLVAASSADSDVPPASETYLISQDKISDILREASRDQDQRLDLEVSDHVTDMMNKYSQPHEQEYDDISVGQDLNVCTSQMNLSGPVEEPPAPLQPQAPAFDQVPNFHAEFASDEVEDSLL